MPVTHMQHTSLSLCHPAVLHSRVFLRVHIWILHLTSELTCIFGIDDIMRPMIVIPVYLEVQLVL